MHQNKTISLNDVCSRFCIPCKSPWDSRELGSSSSEEHDGRIWEDPFAQFHFHMQNEMARLHQIAQNVFNLQRARTVVPVIAKNRPEGHENAVKGFYISLYWHSSFNKSFLNNFLGLIVGNNDKNGEKIMEVKPVESENKKQQVLGYEGENPTVVEVPVSTRVLLFL